MNDYKIPAPFSKSGGKVYTRILVQKYRYDKKINKTLRVGSEYSIRMDNKINIKKLMDKIEIMINDLL